ncbi:GNAT family N-acetyltransferase [Thalassovita taeanensis]|uniref:L-amino acid N-acyltransferase YncA n=1 Tax=Thalassovita taeanensis TaxID=657014 RepID=A0A1H9JHV4_9RHOB|nr:GNAT family N-acetyltransferase [Thalassovita taeanensis]SEQ86363.1 L-amino acid N-acyltransferase YncA [Thalassovita taeanensis]
MIHIRAAGALDAAAMAELLNAIIAQGGTTALTTPVTRTDILDWIARAPDLSAWHIAEDDSGTLLGFQWIAPHAKLPPQAADIATFVGIGKTGLGTGSALFRATAQAARNLGYDWINATIRADNTGGLAYYQSRGFEDYKTETGVQLANGLRVDRVRKRFTL